ncbi:hypothetical protein [Desulfogranum mediterraneum]|nr:hypothetical protein [Desulfogranum mediterraneum]
MKRWSMVVSFSPGGKSFISYQLQAPYPPVTVEPAGRVVICSGS